MSSEPIERRVSYIGDRLRGAKCSICGKEYFRPKDYCGLCGRISFGKMKGVDFFFEKGKLEVCTLVDKPTNRFTKLKSYIYGFISFHDGKVRVPGRLTDYIAEDNRLDLSDFEDRAVVPRFRKRYSVEKNEIVPTIALTFTFADEYYPYQAYNIVKPKKEYDIPGIVGYGVYISRFRIREGPMERSVPFMDEDAITAAVEAGKLALIHSGVDSTRIGKVYVGSESNPYAVKPIASKVAQVLKLGEEEHEEKVQGVDAIDTEFACKAATSMFKDATALAYYPKTEHPYVMVIGADNSQAAPRDEPGGELDFFVGYGGCAFIFGKNDVIAQIDGWYSCTSDTADFWRRDRELYPSHGGRFTGKPAYFKHVIKAASKLMDKMNLKPSDITYFVAHQPNIPYPIKVAKLLGFREEQYLPGLKVNKFGNTYSGSSPVGLASVLDIAEPYATILMASYGSGAGSDAYVISTTPQIKEKRPRQSFNVEFQVNNKFREYIDYETYRQFKVGI